MNAEFQRIARRDKKLFLSDQCKEIAENNRMRKTRDPFKKIRDTKETFHAKMGTVKDRNGRQTLFWGAPNSLQILTAALKLKDAYSLEGKL